MPKSFAKRCFAGLITLGVLAPAPAAAASASVFPFVLQQQAALAIPHQNVSFASARMSKSAAILGGYSSALERIAAQQSGTPVQSVRVPAALPQPASGSPAPWRAEFGFAAPVEAFTSGRPDIFGSIALAVSRTPLDAKWRRASASGFERDGKWTPAIAAFRGLPADQQIEKVNSWVNANIRFVDDRVQYGASDVWANGADALRRGRGDCEDYALAKMQLLRAAGFDPKDMYLSIVKDLVRREDHAVLIVRSGGRLLVLDNNTDRMADARAMQDYRPVFTYSAGRSWTHGYRRDGYAANGAAGAVMGAFR